MSEMPTPVDPENLGVEETAALPYNGCEWPIDPACLVEGWAGLDEDVQARSMMLAGETLRRLTGYRVGGCPITVRPCNAGCANSYGVNFYGMGNAWGPQLWNGTWLNTCGCASACGCSAPSLRLPAPVGEVYEVKIDGDEFTDYVVSGNDLIRTDGDPWPTTQDMTLEDTEINTFSVTYLNSYPVDALGAYAGGILAMEFSKACTGGKCRLPQGVTSVTRLGVSFEVAVGSFPGGVTGIREVDSYIALWNPDRLRQAPQIIYPGQNRSRVIR